MKTAVREALNELYEMEQDNGGDITNLDPNDPQLLKIRGILWNNVDEESESKTKPTDQEIVRYIMEHNEPTSSTAKHFNLGSQSVRCAIERQNMSIPRLYRHQLIKGQRQLFALTLRDVAKFLNLKSVQRAIYVKENGVQIDGWLIYDCRLISWNVPKIVRLEELNKLGIK